MSPTYVCAELVKGFCKTWVEQQPTLLQSLMITKADSIAISFSLAGIFAFIVGFLAIVKATKLI